MYAPQALLLAYSTMPLIVDLYVRLPPQLCPGHRARLEANTFTCCDRECTRTDFHKLLAASIPTCSSASFPTSLFDPAHTAPNPDRAPTASTQCRRPTYRAGGLPGTTFSHRMVLLLISSSPPLMADSNARTATTIAAVKNSTSPSWQPLKSTEPRESRASSRPAATILPGAVRKRWRAGASNPAGLAREGLIAWFEGNDRPGSLCTTRSRRLH
jgi:hypothetical protein